jgi:DNA-binding transcriptional MocR family regulator
MPDFVAKMENAMLMKIHAKSLNSMTYQLAMEETHAEEHLQLLREAIEEYRKLFLEWIKGFDPSEKYDDGWGIFTD